MPRPYACIFAIALASLLQRGVASAADAAPQEPRLICTVAESSTVANAVAKMVERDVVLMCRPATSMSHDLKIIGTVAAKSRSYGPNIDKLLTPQQVDAAWKDWVDQTFQISASP